MKLIRLSIIMFSVLLILNIFINLGVKSSVDKMNEHITKIETVSSNDDTNEYLSLVKELKTDFYKMLDFWKMVINHSEIDEAEESFTKLEAYAKQGDIDNSIAYLYEFRFWIDNLYEREQITITNIL